MPITAAMVANPAWHDHLNALSAYLALTVLWPDDEPIVAWFEPATSA